MNAKSKKDVWRIVSVTMLQGWYDRLLNAAQLRGLAVAGYERGATEVTMYFDTTRTPRQVEDELRAQFQFHGWMVVKEEV